MYGKKVDMTAYVALIPQVVEHIAPVTQRLWIRIPFKSWIFSGHFSSSVMAA